MKKEQQTEESK